MKNQLLLLLLCLSNSLFAQDTTAQKAAGENLKLPLVWKTLDDSAYTIQYPADWEVNRERKTGTTFILFSPSDSDIDSFSENINLLIQDLRGMNIDLNKFTELSKAQLKTIVTNAELIESQRIKNANSEFHKLSYSAHQDVYRLVYVQYYWVINERAYILTFSGEKLRFPEYKTVAESVMNSFVLKK